MLNPDAKPGGKTSRRRTPSVDGAGEFFFFIKHSSLFAVIVNKNTGGPRYMREIGTPNIDSHITNLHLKRPRMTVN